MSSWRRSEHAEKWVAAMFGMSPQRATARFVFRCVSGSARLWWLACARSLAFLRLSLISEVVWPALCASRARRKQGCVAVGAVCCCGGSFGLGSRLLVVRCGVRCFACSVVSFFLLLALRSFGFRSLCSCFRFSRAVRFVPSFLLSPVLASTSRFRSPSCSVVRPPPAFGFRSLLQIKFWAFEARKVCVPTKYRNCNFFSVC